MKSRHTADVVIRLGLTQSGRAKERPAQTKGKPVEYACNLNR